MDFLTRGQIQIAVRFSCGAKINDHIGFTGSNLDPWIAVNFKTISISNWARCGRAEAEHLHGKVPILNQQIASLPSDNCCFSTQNYSA
jgi:hypothetical protein